MTDAPAEQSSGCLLLFRPGMLMAAGFGVLLLERMNKHDRYEWNGLPVTWVGGAFVVLGALATVGVLLYLVWRRIAR